MELQKLEVCSQEAFATVDGLDDKHFDTVVELLVETL